MTDLVKVKDHPGLFRDPISKAIVIDDPMARKNYQIQRNTLVKSMGAAEELKVEINNMKQEIDSIKAMITDLASYLKTK